MQRLIRVLSADDIDLSGRRYLSPRKFYIRKCKGISNEEITEKYGNYDVLLIRSTRKLNKEFLEKCSFKVIATFTRGTDHIDVETAKRIGIYIISSEGANSISAAEHTLALILSVEKKIIFSDRLVRENRFRFYDYERHELAGRKIGIIGFGKVGSRVGKICKAMGMKIFANDISISVKRKHSSFEFRNLDFILRKCDIISIHIPLSKKNFHFFTKKQLMKISKDAVLINTSRGDVIDEAALIEMLKKKKIKFAGLDVFSSEPEINREFAKLENVVLTNHIAGKTIESRRRISDEIFLKLNGIYDDLSTNKR